ncbi:hypothetical protein BH24ACT7_BH24ACT7_04930 [soil metagenome]
MADVTEDRLVALLRTLEGPVDPPAGFADRLYAELTGRHGDRPDAGTAVHPLEPLVVDRAHPVGEPNRRPRRWVAAAAGFGAVALFALLTWAIRPGGDTPPATPTTVPGPLVTYIDPGGRFEVSYPAGWILADEDLTPQGGVGPELFAVGTFPMRPTFGNCSPQPGGALDDMGPGDAFVWVEERPGNTSNDPRPDSFAPLLDGVDENTDTYLCMDPAERAELGVLQWLSFTDAGSDFYAVVAVGRDAPASLMAAAAAVLDSFTPAPFDDGIQRTITIPDGLDIADLGWDGDRIWVVAHQPVDGGPPPEEARVMAFDPGSADLLASVVLDGSPVLVAGDAEAVWVAHWGTGNLTRLDPATAEVEAEVELELPFDVGAGDDRRRFVPTGLVVDDGVVWVLTARGALAEVRDGGDRVVIHELPIGAQPESLHVAGGTAWVGAGAGVYAVTTGGEVRVLAEALNHPAQRLGFDDRLIVGGDYAGETSALTVLDPATGEVLDTIDLPAALVAIGTVDGRFGAIDTAGVLYLPGEEGSIGAWFTDLAGPEQTVQVGDELWTVTASGGALRRVGVTGAAPEPLPIAIPEQVARRPPSPGMLASSDWEPLDPGPLALRFLASLQVWTGEEFVLWALQPEGDTAVLADPAAYNPATATWREIAPAPFELGVHDVSGLWAGDELVVWTSEAAAAWDPESDTWRVIPDWPLQPTSERRAVWTGEEIIDIDADLAVDPTTGASRPIAPGPPFLDERASVVWGDGRLVVVPRGGAYDAVTDTWLSSPPSGLTPLATGGVWTGTEVFAADYLMEASGYDPDAATWSPYPTLPLRFYECGPQAHVVDGRPLVEHCSGLALWEPGGGYWLPISLPSLYGNNNVLSTGDAVYSTPNGLHRLADHVLDTGPRRLAVGVGILDLPEGWTVGTTSGAGAADPSTPQAITVDLDGPEGASCLVRAIHGDAVAAIRPFLVPGYDVTGFEYVVGGQPVEAVSVPTGLVDDFDHLVWAMGGTDVIDVGCSDPVATADIARNLWSPWQ